MEQIKCACKTCKVNGAVGAMVPTALLDTLGRKRSTIHGLVWNANDPSFVGKLTRERLSISAL